MTSIEFTVRPGVSDARRDEILTHVRALAGVQDAAALQPESRSASVRRMCFVRAADGANLNDLVSKIQALPDVESATVPTPRRMSGGRSAPGA